MSGTQQQHRGKLNEEIPTSGIAKQQQAVQQALARTTMPDSNKPYNDRNMRGGDKQTSRTEASSYSANNCNRSPLHIQGS